LEYSNLLLPEKFLYWGLEEIGKGMPLPGLEEVLRIHQV
jgi:hypothetical protein